MEFKRKCASFTYGYSMTWRLLMFVLPIGKHHSAKLALLEWCKYDDTSCDNVTRHLEILALYPG